MKIKSVPFLIFLLLFLAEASTDKSASDLAEFVRCNSAGKSINVVPATGAKSDSEKAMKMYLELSKNESELFRVAYTSKLDNVGASKEDFTVVTMSEATKEAFLRAFQALTLTTIRTSAILIFDKMGDAEFEYLIEAGEELMVSSFFYLAHLDDVSDPNWKWNQIITLKGQSKTVVNSLDFVMINDRKMVIVEKYDLQGLNVTSYSLTWSPYLQIGRIHTVVSYQVLFKTIA